MDEKPYNALTNFLRYRYSVPSESNTRPLGVKMKNNSGSPLQSVASAAAYLGVSEKCMYKWLYERRFASIRVGRLVRIKTSDLDAFIAAGTTPARAEAR